MNHQVQTSGTAIASLVFGIVAWVALPFIGAIVAVICGHLARAEIRRNAYGAIDGDGLAVAGLVLGYVQLAFCLLVVVGIILIIAFGLGSGFFWR